MSAQLIPVVASVIGNQSVQAVDGRALHIFLEVETRFNDWIDRRIEEYGFEENRDFYSFLSKTPKGGRPTKEYTLALDMAKELAMVERTPKGKQARQYFIECERIALHAQPQPADPAALAQQLADLLKGKVIVDYEALCRFARMTRVGLEKIAEGEKLLEEAEQVGLGLERQCGKPLIKFDIPADRLARHRATPPKPRSKRPAAPPDPWEPQVRAYVAGRQEVTSTLVLTHLGVPTAEQTQVPKNRIAKILIGLGFVGYRVKRAGSTRRIWQRHHHA